MDYYSQVLTTSNESHGAATRRYTPLAPVRGDAPIQNKSKLEPNSNFGVGFALDIAPPTDERSTSHILSVKKFKHLIPAHFPHMGVAHILEAHPDSHPDTLYISC